MQNQTERSAAALERARRFFAGDIYATEVTGIQIDDVAPGYAKCSLAIGRIHLNAGNRVMGGVLFTLADFAFAVAANEEQPITFTQSANITFHGPAAGTRLIAEAKEVRSGKNTCYFMVEVRDDFGNLLASVTENGFRTGLNRDAVKPAK